MKEIEKGLENLHSQKLFYIVHIYLDFVIIVYNSVYYNLNIHYISEYHSIMKYIIILNLNNSSPRCKIYSYL